MPKKPKKGRKAYLCSKCHQPKKGHICTATILDSALTKPKKSAKIAKLKRASKTSEHQTIKIKKAAKLKKPKKITKTSKPQKIKTAKAPKNIDGKRHQKPKAAPASAPPPRPRSLGQKPPSAGNKAFNASMQSSSLETGLALAIQAVNADANLWPKHDSERSSPPVSCVSSVLDLYEGAVHALLPACKGAGADTLGVRKSVAQYLRRITVLKTLRAQLSAPVTGGYPVVSRSAYRKKLKAAGVDVSGQDVGHIIASANGGADHDHNYTMQGAYYNRSMGNKHDAIMCALEGIAKARLAVTASRAQKGYNGPSAEELVAEGNRSLKALRMLHSGLDGSYWTTKNKTKTEK